MRKSIFGFGAAIVACTSSYLPSASAATYATAIFDRTASMNITRPADGLSRCEYGKQLFIETVGIGIERADFLNIKTFGAPGNIVSLSSGFKDVRGLNRYAGAGKTFYDQMVASITSTPCSEGSTALGDALCESIDQLEGISGFHQRRIGLVTDAAENRSQQCGNPPGASPDYYVINHIEPRLISPPGVILNMSILNTGGNVSSFAARSLVTSQENAVEKDAPPTKKSSARSSIAGQSVEIRALIEAAKNSGGGAIVIGDNEICTNNCDPDSQEPPTWGGGW